MHRSVPTVTIAGAGPAGLAAALAIVRRGGRARVLEMRDRTGARFHGDFQGLENWSTRGDVLAELGSLQIEASFEHTPFRECVLFDEGGREHVCRSPEPLWYLVRRGSGTGTLDRSLEDQALAAGVEIEFDHAATRFPEGGIVAHGPMRVDALAVGYLFETDRADGAFAAVSEDLAPGGYAYLLICRGRATLATCLFAGFHDEKIHLERTLDLFRRKVGIRLRNESRFGGFGAMSVPAHLRRGRLLFAGEAAGLQDALLGFGMRYALMSGHLAGAAFASGDLDGYERACERQLLPLARAAAACRFLYERTGAHGRSLLLERLCATGDPRAWLHRRYAHRLWTPLVYPFARAAARRRQERDLSHECREGCDCTWCRCVRQLSRTPSARVAEAG